MRTPHLSRPSHTLATHHNGALEGSMAAGTASPASMFEKRSRPDRTFAYTDMAGYESTEFMSYPLLQPSEAYSPLPLPPHINLQRPSEPASPITIASTLSHTSSPSPSPSRTQPTTEPSHDFLLFDETLQSGANIYPAKRFQGGHRRFGSGSSLASDPGVSHTSHPAGQYNNGNTVFPVIAQQDSFANSAFGNNYLVQSHLVGNDQMLFDMGKQVPKAASRQMLQPPIHFGGQNAMAVAQALMQHHGHSDDEDQVPGLSPASRPSGPTGSSSRPSISSEGFRSPSSPSRTPDQFHDLATQSATPRIYASSTQLSPHTPNMSHMSDVQGMISDFPNLFQKAQREHSIAQASPSKGASGHHSAFRVSSPYHPQHDASQEVYPARMSTAHEQRIKDREFAAAEMLRQQMENEAANATTPKTISPKDSLLEYHGADGQHETSKFFDGTHGGHAPVSTLGDIYSTSQFYTAGGDNDTEASFGSMATSRRESSTGSLHRTPSNQMQYAQFSHLSTPQFPYVRSQLQSVSQRQNAEAFGTMSVDQPGKQPASGFELGTKVSKPAVAKANIGTYTCTFEGCGQRFTTSAKLQRHRRESHRHASTDGAIGSAMSPAAVAARNAQPGPHKCTRVNPSTGKPCNIVFSRPYDLTRHEDTIHNAGKEKVRCEICTDEKTFSRYDALVRHKRVKHGIVDRH